VVPVGGTARKGRFVGSFGPLAEAEVNAGCERSLSRPRRGTGEHRCAAASPEKCELFSALMYAGPHRLPSKVEPMVQEFDKVGVVGLGTMGAGIAEVFARAGFNVVGVEIDQDACDRGRGHVDRSLSRAVGRGKISEEERAAIDARLTFTTSREDLSDADFVVEAVPEHMNIKQDVF